MIHKKNDILNDSKLLFEPYAEQIAALPQVVQLIATHTKCIMRAAGGDFQYKTRGP